MNNDEKKNYLNALMSDQKFIYIYIYMYIYTYFESSSDQMKILWPVTIQA